VGYNASNPGKSDSRSKNNSNASGKASATSGPKIKKKKRSVMRESTWDRMSVGQRRNEFGTASYKKYKEGSKPSETKKFASRGID
jgi:hypothetical protein